MTTLSQTKNGNYQITSNVTYCFGDCKEWAIRFYRTLISKETTVLENEYAKIVFCEAWGYSVESKTSAYKDGRAYRYPASSIDNARRWFGEIADNVEKNKNKQFNKKLPDTWNILINA